jgi:signal transduction histidine kinase
VAVVALCGLVLHREAGLGASLVATATVAVLFGPVRTRLQRGANRLLYGQRDEPYVAVANLGMRLSATENADATLRALAETVAQALRLPYAAVELRHGGRLERIAATGRPPWGVARIPLAYGGEELGAIAVCPRAPGESFNAADRHLLSELARQAAAAAHAIVLADDLQRARERIVTAREEERRHLRYELHDRIGPSLAGMTLQLDALRRLAEQDTDAAAEAVRGLRLEAAGALDDVRSLARGLRPPVLDALGLVGALRQLGEDCAPLELRLDVRDELQSLPAATEVAAYRIAQDVVSQLADTPGARSATLRLRGGQALELEFTAEDAGGAELSLPVAGAVRERAEELGGSCVSEPRLAGGRRLRARLPLAVEAVA